MNVEAKLKTCIEETVEKAGYSVYEIKWTNETGHDTLQIAIMDSHGKMDIDTCAEVSQLVGDKLDEEDLITKEYYLEVCSPGAERELRSNEQVLAAKGEYVYVKLIDPEKGIDSLYGTLLNVDEDLIEMQYLVKNIKKKIKIERKNIKLIRMAVKV